jgi:hypothetical protein
MNDKNQNKEAKELAKTLNGQENAADFKLITHTIQDVNPVTFTEQCETALKNIIPESMVSYNIQNVLMNVRNNQALVFICNIQYWSDSKTHAEWIADIKRQNLLIKP